MNAERQARAVWTVIAEPGDLVAGELVSWVGGDRALRWVRSVRAGRTDWSLLVDESGLTLSPQVRRGLVTRAQTWAQRLEAASAALDVAVAMGVDVVVPGDPHWPAGLDDLATAAPHALWLRGSLGPPPVTTAGSVALVGSRSCTAYGERTATELADALAARGAVVVSGGAYGIDAAVHRGALSSGVTWAVVAGGPDRDYPAGHRRLFRQVVDDGGALLGEAPPGAVPARHRFLQRNRLIAALTAGTVVVEAAWRSGALSTANHAAGLLRPVGAVPGPVTSPASAGCHRLMREGAAVCVTDADEVVELIGLADVRVGDQRAVATTPADGLDTVARAVHQALSARTTRTPAELVERTGGSLSAVRASLGRLDLAGLVVRDGEGWRAVAIGAAPGAQRHSAGAAQH
ncbi:MAG: DNA-processing protein DprA [Micrococcales bacterium]|nr:DNA-processing protein DprA [Micrococcales bacterium]